MKILNPNTTSLCVHCYKHISARTIIENGSVFLEKTCPLHGFQKFLVEPNADFYTDYIYGQNNLYHTLDAICLDITNRCNLQCPHCYQIPNNQSKDPSINSIIAGVEQWPDQKAVVLMGAEPTIRNDLPELIDRLNKIAIRPIMILSNGVRMSDIEYAKQFTKFKNVYFTIGLNHPDYQGPTVRYKQECGLDNCVKLNIPIKNISYTLDGFGQLEYCLHEIQKFNSEKNYCKMYRIRVGTAIGRSPEQDKMFMSELVEKSRYIAKQNNWSFIPKPESGIRAHYPVEIAGVRVKLIQWPDAQTLDLDEIQTESWADMLPGKPISPLVHQVLLRDRLVNNNQPLLDTVPKKYRLQ
jgi:hypothetical protein